MDRRIFFEYPSHDDKGKACRRVYAVRVEGLSVEPPKPVADDASAEQLEAYEKAEREYRAADHEHRTRSRRAHLDVAAMRRHKGGGAIQEEEVPPLPPEPKAPDPPPGELTEEDEKAHAAALEAHAKVLGAAAKVKAADCRTYGPPTSDELKEAALIDFARHSMGSDAEARRLWEENLRGLRREAFAKKGGAWIDPDALAKEQAGRRDVTVKPN